MKKNAIYLQIVAIYLLIIPSAWGQSGSDCANVVSSTISLSSQTGLNCTYTFTPTVTINDKPKLIQFAFTAGGTTLYACYNYDAINVEVDLLGIQSTECGSDNAFFPKGSTLTFPPATITLPCGTGSIAFTAYNGAASGKPTGKCANAPVTITPDPLPVKLVAFECEVSNEGILLKWQTTEEINSNKFVVQRSQNAIEFKDIVELNSVGTTNEISEYDFLDYTAPFGINYYRLMQIDLDGSIDYSKIISIKKETIENETFTIFPNPVTTAHFTLQGTDKKIVSARLLSINGEKFELEPAKWNDSKQEIELPSSIKNGLYILHIQTAEKTIIRKIIIE